jgi:hypothetical protein
MMAGNVGGVGASHGGGQSHSGGTTSGAGQASGKSGSQGQFDAAKKQATQQKGQTTGAKPNTQPAQDKVKLSAEFKKKNGVVDHTVVNVQRGGKNEQSIVTVGGAYKTFSADGKSSTTSYKDGTVYTQTPTEKKTTFTNGYSITTKNGTTTVAKDGRTVKQVQGGYTTSEGSKPGTHNVSLGDGTKWGIDAKGHLNVQNPDARTTQTAAKAAGQAISAADSLNTANNKKSDPGFKKGTATTNAVQTVAAAANGDVAGATTSGVKTVTDAVQAVTTNKDVKIGAKVVSLPASAISAGLSAKDNAQKVQDGDQTAWAGLLGSVSSLVSTGASAVSTATEIVGPLVASSLARTNTALTAARTAEDAARAANAQQSTTQSQNALDQAVKQTQQLERKVQAYEKFDSILKATKTAAEWTKAAADFAAAATGNVSGFGGLALGPAV